MVAQYLNLVSEYIISVSYTHLDVYKRQLTSLAKFYVELDDRACEVVVASSGVII